MTPGTGTRVVSAVRQAADGSCTGAPISFSAGINYTLTTNDFTAGGGDGYPNNRSRMTTHRGRPSVFRSSVRTTPSRISSQAASHSSLLPPFT